MIAWRPCLDVLVRAREFSGPLGVLVEFSLLLGGSRMQVRVFDGQSFGSGGGV
jgi:hypothetical protein